MSAPCPLYPPKADIEMAIRDLRSVSVALEPKMSALPPIADMAAVAALRSEFARLVPSKSANGSDGPNAEKGECGINGAAAKSKGRTCPTRATRWRLS